VRAGRQSRWGGEAGAFAIEPEVPTKRAESVYCVAWKIARLPDWKAGVPAATDPRPASGVQSLEGRVGFEPTTPGLKGTDRGLIAEAADSKSGVKSG
jgi:hypothetical protein